MGTPRRVKGNKIIYSPSKNKGIADILCCIDSKFIAIEIKTVYKKSEDKLSPEQIRFQENVVYCKGEYWIVRNFDDFLNHWNYFLKTQTKLL